MANKPLDYNVFKNYFLTQCSEIKVKYPKDWWSHDSETDETYQTKMADYLSYGIYRLEKYLLEHPSIKLVGAEIPIDFNYKNEKRFIGSIDRLLYDTATDLYIIQDIKAWSGISKHSSDLTTPLQLVVYTLALSEMKNHPVEKIKCQYDLPLPDKVYDAGTAGFLKQGSTKIDSLFAGIAAQDFSPKPTSLCHWCDYCRTNTAATDKFKYLCPYASVWTPENKINISEQVFIALDRYPEDLKNYHKRLGLLNE